jgi:NAD(P)-dependent dehydrogenase (short-subunit alcohol dehydrogenase family)
MKKTIIVTGTSSGFGLLTVKELAKQGHTVYATMRNVTTKNAKVAQELKSWAGENNVDIRVFELDVTSDSSVKAAITEIGKDSNGRIDVLVNNAGLFMMGLSETVTTKQLEDIFQINVFGVDRVIKAVLPYMHKQHEGLLITLSSGLARLHLPYVGAYTATKTAIDVIATTYHFELSRLGIDSIVIQPGAIPTELWHKSSAPEDLSAVRSYGEHGAQIKEGIEKVFVKTPESPDPQIVADVIARVINTPQGQRDMWNVIGMGGLEPTVEAINNSTGEFSKGVQTSLGIAY